MSATISIHQLTSSPAPVAPEVVTIDRGWHPDPLRQHDLRFHDGSTWTEHVTHFGPVPCRACNPGRN